MQDNESDRSNSDRDEQATVTPLEGRLPKDAAVQEDAAIAERGPGPGKPPSGRRVRISLLVANLALIALCNLVGTYLNEGQAVWNARVFVIGLDAALQTIRLAPLLLLTALAAWGPWRPWVRCLMLVSVMAAETTLHQAVSWSLAFGYRSETPFWLETVRQIMQMLVIFVPAACSLALFGSWLSLRIGPVGRPPIRSSILAVMIATGALGAVMAGKLMADRMDGRSSVVTELEGNESVQIAEMRLEIFLQTFYGGTIIAMAIGCMVAAAYRWWARILELLLIAAYGGISYYFASQAAPQFPFRQTNILLVLYSGMILGLAVVCFWIPINIRWLDRSGWPCSRRRRIVATAT